MGGTLGRRDAPRPEGAAVEQGRLGEPVELLRIALDAAPAGVAVADADGRILLASAGTARILDGPAAGDALGPGGARATRPDGSPIPSDELPLTVALAGRSVTDQEILVGGGERGARFILASATPLRAEGGAVVGAVTVFQDITARREAEQALRQSEGALRQANERLESILLAAEVGTASYEPALDRARLDANTARLFGLEPVEVENLELASLLERVHPEDRGCAAEAVRAALEQGRPYRTEYRVVRPDGTVRWLLSRGRAVLDCEGRPVLHAVMIDVTERREALARLEEEKRRLDLLTGATSDLLALLDREGRILYASRSAVQALERVAEELPGRRLPEVAPDWLPSALADDVARVLETGERVRGEDSHTGGSAGPVTYEYLLDPVPGEDGQPSGVVAVAREITERRAREAELLEARARLAERDKAAMVGSLASAVAHELRNPLGSIKNAAYFLERVLARGDEMVDQALEVLRTEVDRTNLIVTALLDFAWPPEARAATFPLAELARRTVEVLTGEAPELEVAVEVEPELEVRADPGQVGRVLGSLVANAVQAMAGRGRLSVRCRRADGLAAIEVGDTGPGIEEQDLERVFTPLFSTKPRGLGLGLAIARELAGRNGGRIEVRSKPGEGSTFTVLLPAAEPAPAASGAGGPRAG